MNRRTLLLGGIAAATVRPARSAAATVGDMYSVWGANGPSLTETIHFTAAEMRLAYHAWIVDESPNGYAAQLAAHQQKAPGQ